MVSRGYNKLSFLLPIVGLGAVESFESRGYLGISASKEIVHVLESIEHILLSRRLALQARVSLENRLIPSASPLEFVQAPLGSTTKAATVLPLLSEERRSVGDGHALLEVRLLPADLEGSIFLNFDLSSRSLVRHALLVDMSYEGEFEDMLLKGVLNTLECTTLAENVLHPNGNGWGVISAPPKSYDEHRTPLALWLSLGPSSDWNEANAPRERLRQLLSRILAPNSSSAVFVAANGFLNWHSLLSTDLQPPPVLFLGLDHQEWRSTEKPVFHAVAAVAGMTPEDASQVSDSDELKGMLALKALKLTGGRYGFLQELLGSVSSSDESTFVSSLSSACDAFEAAAAERLSHILSKEPFEENPLLWFLLEALCGVAQRNDLEPSPNDGSIKIKDKQTQDLQMTMEELYDAIGGVGAGGHPIPEVVESLRNFLSDGLIEILPATNDAVKLRELPRGGSTMQAGEVAKEAFIQQEQAVSPGDDTGAPIFVVSVSPQLQAGFLHTLSGSHPELVERMQLRVSCAHFQSDLKRLNEEATVAGIDWSAHLDTVAQIDEEVRSQLTQEELDNIDFEILRGEKSILQRCETISLRREGLVAATKSFCLELKGHGITNTNIESAASEDGEEAAVQKEVLGHMGRSQQAASELVVVNNTQAQSNFWSRIFKK